MSLNWGKIGLAFGGALFGSYGVKILSSKTMKKAYTHCTAAVLRMKDEVIKDATVLKENCDDILADANDINEKLYAEEEAQMIEDAKAILAEAAEETPAAGPA